MFSEYVDGLRELAEFRMGESSRVTVRRSTGRMVQDEQTGMESPEWVVVHADLPFRLAERGGMSGSAGSRKVNIGGIEFQQATAEGHLPADTFDLEDDDHIEITAGEWPGTVWRVVEAVKGDQRTARRVPIIEASRPEEW